MNRIIPRSDSSLKSIGSLFGRDKANAVNSIFSYIDEYLTGLRKSVIVGMLNINISEYIMFTNIIPIVHSYGNDSYQVIFRRSKYTNEETKFCLDYVINYALSVQKNSSNVR